MDYVYGLNKSGQSIVKLLKKNKIEYKYWDDDNKVRKKLQKNTIKELFVPPIKKNLLLFDNIYVSPGITIRTKKFTSKHIKDKVKRDTNLYLSNIGKEKIIAVTGTNGKSTTTKLIGDILKKNNKRTFIGGNIGNPLCNSLIKKNDFNYHVIELSSFQLETVKNVESKISIITNLSSDHRDRYNSIKDYILQKENILSNKGFNLISIDDHYSKKIFNIKNNLRKISFSIKDSSADIYFNKNVIIDNFFYKKKSINIEKISKDLYGDFNKQNILITYICSKILKIKKNIFLDTVSNFKGLPYRSEVIYNKKNCIIVNNSKSTNLNSTINSIKSFSNILLILGGIAKENNFSKLIKFKNKILCAYLYGQSAMKIKRSINKKINTKKFNNIDQVVSQLFKDLKSYDKKVTILYAPGCSSFDQFINFEHRGFHFKKIIKKFIKVL